MAELLILNKSNTNPDAVKSERGCYKRGDIVEVREDGAAYGTAETLPDFVIVRLTT